jgi:hypothetical protein
MKQPLQRSLAVVAWIAVLAVAAPVSAEGDVNFFLGGKKLDDDDWSDSDVDVSEQGEFGAQISVGKAAWPVRIAIDVLGSSKEDEIGLLDVEGKTSEIALGVRKIWTKGKVRPFVGGGLVHVSAEGEFAAGGFDVSDDDSAGGLWADGGVFWRLGQRFNIGFDVRLSAAEVELFQVDTEAGGSHLGLLLGWGWD